MIITFILLIILTLFNFFLFRDIKYPPFILSLIWCIIYLLFISFNTYFYKVNDLIHLIILCGVFFFSLGSFTINTKKFKKQTYSVKKDLFYKVNVDKKMIYLFFLISFLGFILIMGKGFYIGINGPTNNFFMNIRMAQWNYIDVQGYGKLSYFLWVNYFSMAIFLATYYSTQKYRVYTIICTITALLNSIMFTGRGFLIWWSIIFFGLGILFKKVKIKSLFIFILLFIVIIFPLYSLILDKGIKVEDLYMGNMNKIIEQYLVYLVSPLPAFSQSIAYLTDFEFPSNTLIKLGPIFENIGFDIKRVNIVKEFVFTPYPTNIYTGLEPYFKDLGFFGVIFFQYLFGLIHGYFYSQLSKCNLSIINIVWFILLFYPLIMQYSGDYYLSTLNTWIIFLIATLFYKIVGKDILIQIR